MRNNYLLFSKNHSKMHTLNPYRNINCINKLIHTSIILRYEIFFQLFADFLSGWGFVLHT